MNNLNSVFYQICQNLRGAKPEQPKPPAAEHPLFGPVIYAYTRAQAIEDGVLINIGMFVTDDGRPVLEAIGIRLPVAMTSTAYTLVIGERDGQLLDVGLVLRRVVYFLARLKHAILHHRGDPTVLEFTCTNAELKPIALKVVAGPGDDGRPVLTVMLPMED